MNWSTLRFGKYEGKTLPQVLFTDPDWFFWAVSENAFEKQGKKISQEAADLNKKAKNIRIPQNGPEKMVAEYAIHHPTKKFSHMELVPFTRPKHVGSTSTFRSNSIDMSIPRKIAAYDKLGGKHLISNIKYYLFGSKSYRMTKDKCEAFFADDNNFDL